MQLKQINFIASLASSQSVVVVVDVDVILAEVATIIALAAADDTYRPFTRLPVQLELRGNDDEGDKRRQNSR